MPSFQVTRNEESGPAFDAALGADGPALAHLRLDPRDPSPFACGGDAPATD